jgi:hypothetical protein
MFISRNLLNEEQHNKSSAVFLGVTRGDSFVEFTADPSTHIPLDVRDQRFCLATSQPYAASSYGISQVIPSSWNQYGSTYNQYLDISKVPIFTLLSDYRTGALLAAARHHKTAMIQGIPNSGKSRSEYEDNWSKVFYRYNAGGFGYNHRNGPLIGIIRQGSMCFEPSVTSPSSCGEPTP